MKHATDPMKLQCDYVLPKKIFVNKILIYAYTSCVKAHKT